MSTPAGSAAYSRWIYGLKGGLRLQAEKFIICTGGVSRRLPIPGFELTSTHSDAWRLTSIPPSMLVVGAGATGAQVASIFNAFGTRVQLFEAGTRILSTEDEDVATAAAESISVRGCGRTLIQSARNQQHDDPEAPPPVADNARLKPTSSALATARLLEDRQMQ
jgi:pyruvate/2-oxoglutarate dehydrogenase complex dihydrolipoamide dehydrogenase (E3) component